MKGLHDGLRKTLGKAVPKTLGNSSILHLPPPPTTLILHLFVTYSTPLTWGVSTGGCG